MTDPKLREMAVAIWNAIDDFLCDDKVGLSDQQIDAITKLIYPIICTHAGHNVQMDQCGKPEHDYCIWCNERVPGKAEGRDRKNT